MMMMKVSYIVQTDRASAFVQKLLSGGGGVVDHIRISLSSIL